MAIEIISLSISMKVRYQPGIELMTPGSAVRHFSAVKYATDCATRAGILKMYNHVKCPNMEAVIVTLGYNYMYYILLTLCIPETLKPIILQTVKTQMKCSIMLHFFRVYTVCKG